MRHIIPLLLALLPLPAWADIPIWWQKGAVYTGQGVQSDGPEWTIELTVTGPQTARIAYPSIPCAGRLNVLVSTAGSIMAEEQITENRAACINGGLVRLRYDDGGVLRFYWSNGGTGMTARGTLSQPGS
jgi:hypothetical protein